MTTLETRKTLTRPARICEWCQLESSEHLYTLASGAMVCADCANQEDES